jgi:multidrug efflux system membrane fusion protein
VDGRVGLRQVDAGNYVQVTDANGIVVITLLQPISVIFTIAEDSIPQVMKRLDAGATLQVQGYDRSNTTLLATGSLETVDNQVDTTTGTVKLRASFTNKDDSLFPSQFVNARLLVNTFKATAMVPNAAIQRGAPGTYVYLVNANNTVSVRPVTIGPADDTNTAITKGLAAGDKVVIDGADRLRDGAPIAERNDTKAPAAAAATPPPRQRQGSRRGGGAAAPPPT